MIKQKQKGGSQLQPALHCRAYANRKHPRAPYIANRFYREDFFLSDHGAHTQEPKEQDAPMKKESPPVSPPKTVAPPPSAPVGWPSTRRRCRVVANLVRSLLS